MRRFSACPASRLLERVGRVRQPVRVSARHCRLHDRLRAYARACRPDRCGCGPHQRRAVPWTQRYPFRREQGFGYRPRRARRFDTRDDADEEHCAVVESVPTLALRRQSERAVGDASRRRARVGNTISSSVQFSSGVGIRRYQVRCVLTLLAVQHVREQELMPRDSFPETPATARTPSGVFGRHFSSTKVDYVPVYKSGA